VIASVWAGFIYFSTNAEKANSSIVKAVLFELRSNPSVLAALGQSIKPEKDDMFGQLWVDGQVRGQLLPTRQKKPSQFIIISSSIASDLSVSLSLSLFLSLPGVLSLDQSHAGIRRCRFPSHRL
jgi:hypothetical protein